MFILMLSYRDTKKYFYLTLVIFFSLGEVISIQEYFSCVESVLSNFNLENSCHMRKYEITFFQILVVQSSPTGVTSVKKNLSCDKFYENINMLILKIYIYIIKQEKPNLFKL